ncbi:hypothetical protein BJV78DRAFT_1154081 [Lactifluus subvellereus]|nr:hypothetical protein BJV78DRAFT_1154081 [Lactifluus subvellereus]
MTRAPQNPSLITHERWILRRRRTLHIPYFGSHQICPDAIVFHSSFHASAPFRNPADPLAPRILIVPSSFEALLDETVGSPGLALEIKKAEMVTGDLATLPAEASLLSTTTLFMRSNPPTPKPSALSLSRLWPFSPSEAATTKVVTRTFTEAMNTLSANMQLLVLGAEVSMSDLNKLEEHLKSIHEVVFREDSSISMARAELLTQLWTKLGGNRGQLSGMDEHLALLKGVGGYRDRALAQVVAVLRMLETMAEDMEDVDLGDVGDDRCQQAQTRKFAPAPWVAQGFPYTILYFSITAQSWTLPETSLENLHPAVKCPGDVWITDDPIYGGGRPLMRAPRDIFLWPSLRYLKRCFPPLLTPSPDQYGLGYNHYAIIQPLMKRLGFEMALG